MKMENFTQKVSRRFHKWTSLGFLMVTMLFVNDAFSQNPCPLACNNFVQVSMDIDCEVDITPDMMLEGQGTNQACNYTVTVLDENENPLATSPTVTESELGKTLKVRVNLGFNSCWGYIKIEDKMPPTIDCPGDITLDCYDISPLTLPPATDNCSGSVSVKILSDDVEDSTCEGDTTAIRTVRFQAVDLMGNKSRICTQRIYYIKIGLDDVVFPPNRDDKDAPALECDSNPNDNFAADWDDNGDGYPQPSESGVPETTGGHPIYPGNNTFCELNATFTDQVLPICESSFKVLRHWTVMDWCTGEIMQRYQVVKVVDKFGPIVTCPTDNQDVQADPYSCTGTWNVPHPIQIFDCSSTTYTVAYLLADNNGNPPVNGVYIDDNVVRINDNTGKFLRYEIRKLPVGRTWIRYTVEDACGNISRCFTEVDVVDNVPPTAVCDQFTVVTLTNNATTQGVASIFAKTFDDGSHDNCTEVMLDVRRRTSGCGQSTSTFADRVNFCCQDVGRDIMVELRVTDKNGLSNTCMVNVQVQDKTDPVITCPPNITIDCELDYKDLDITGRAEAYDNCGTPTITFTDNTTPSQCGTGTIVRTFRATIANTSKTCTQIITIRNNTPFKSSDINWSQIYDRDLNGCFDIDTDPSVTGRPTWNEDDCSLIAASYQDQVFTLVDSVCFKILRTWTVVDWCQYNQSSPNSGGIFVRTQILKLSNYVKPEFTDCTNKTADGFGVNCDGFITLVNDATDDCTPSSKLKMSYRIDEFNDGTYGPVRNGKDASGTYKVGTHKILWMVEDLCGNRNTCEYTFTIRDRKKPTPYCLSEITTVIMPSSKEIDIWASDFDKGSFDNCPGTLQISFSSNVNDTKRVFTCDHLGINMLEMWVTDAAGNKDFCTVRINIQSNDGTCDGSRVAGYISTEDKKKVEGVKVALANRTSNETMINNSSAQGAFEFTGMVNQTEYELKPSKDDNHLNGVSTLDLVMIQRHILGIEKLKSPYKIIAADINNSESISASDLVELRKLILGIYNEFPKNDSWRFVEAAYHIPEEDRPWPFNQVIEFMFDGKDMMENNFTAVKVGDVNASVKANARDIDSETRSGKKLELSIKDVRFEAGEVLRIPVSAARNANVVGFQFGLALDTDRFEFVGIESRNIPLTEDNIGLVNLDGGIVRTSWNNLNAFHLEEGSVLFDLVVKAKTEGSLKGSLSIADETAMRAEAYDEGLDVMDVQLDVRERTAFTSVELFQNTPNPFDNSTTITFNLPEDGQATIKVADITGKVVYTVRDQYTKGMNSVVITSQDLKVSGILYYMLEVNGHVYTKKMLSIRE